ncbi:IS66 family transposase [Viscerimonas tarda]
MQIDNSFLQDFLHCPYKAYTKSRQETGLKTEYEALCVRLKAAVVEKFRTACAEKIMEAKFEFNVNFENEHVSLTLDAVEHRDKKTMVPVYIVPFGKITKTDRLFVALQAAFITREFQRRIEHCRIVSGREMKQSKFNVITYAKNSAKLIGEISKILSQANPPLFFKNTHCQMCEFRGRCMEKLRERDDLSLLPGLNPVEIQQRNNRGIFSIKQLSYTFRPRKNPYRKRKFLPELKALALREHKTFIHEIPALPSAQTEIFLDMEGLPDKDFYYLIGVIVKTQDGEQRFSFWADDRQDEDDIFSAFISLLEPMDNYTVYHYGSYEIQALKAVSKKLPAEKQQALKVIIAASCNLLSCFTYNLYPPTYGNGLKDIARFLKFEWTGPNASGLQSIVWRYDWEMNRDEALKQELICYNMEDCEALARVKQWISSIQNEDNGQKQFASELKQENLFKWGITNYLLKDFEEVNAKAYFDYQREHIFLRTEKKIYRAAAREKSDSTRYNRIDRKINLFPVKCRKCGSGKIRIFRTARKSQIDLVFMKQGIKKRVTEYEGGAYRCFNCKKNYDAGNMRKLPHYGYNLMLWAVNQKIQYRLSSESIRNILKDSFALEASNTQISHFKEVIASRYAPAYREIIGEMVSSDLIQADETMARIKGIDGYVWVFANHQSVYYRFRETREPDFLRDLLKGFEGVLVSDFYTGYDFLECKQQKCLVHLIRDMNEDLLKHQFDEELKLIVREFGVLLRAIVATIDEYGLKQRHLKKHNKDVERFYKQVVYRAFESERATFYQKRLSKYREKIFLFLNHNNIPWNNNNAEHSIKPFAKWRKRVSKSLTQQNIENHLILLSILQTCKYRGINFFDFLKSGETLIPS